MSRLADLRKLRGRFGPRLVAGMLAVSIPVTVAVAALLTREASRGLTAASRSGVQLLARALALHIEDFVTERFGDLAIIAAEGSAGIESPTVAAIVGRVDKTYPVYDAIEVTDLTGRVVASARRETSFDPSSQPWFRTVAGGQRVVTSPIEGQGDIQWYIAAPVLDPAGHPAGVVVGDLDEGVFSDLLKVELTGSGAEVSVVDRARRLVYASFMGAADDAALLAKGALRTTVVNAAVVGALAGESGSTLLRDGDHTDVGGYVHVDSIDWAVIVSQHRDEVLAPVRHARNLAVVLTLVGTVIVVAFALLFARRTTRPLAALAGAAAALASGDLNASVEPAGPEEVRGLGEVHNATVATLRGLIDQMKSASTDVSTAASDLSAAAEELAATTTEQSAAVTEVSATTEELARASGSIAETVDEVAVQSTETRDNLERAESDIVASSERTLALAERVGQIGAILTLINEISDQTNLLALNAAIEAARAGDSGRGFAVVADEVRRLAERSKASAAEIATIVAGVHAETTATVMAMEKGASQMQRGLRLLEGVTDATSQVRLTTQQQHSATGQVVETMEHLTDASRQVSATAQQIASSAALLAKLSADLQGTAEVASVNGNGRT